MQGRNVEIKARAREFDQVEGLGEFVELEVVLSDGQGIEEGREIARAIMEQLGIAESDLLEET